MRDCGTPKVLEIACPESPILFHKVIIPAEEGDETTFPPKNGLYKNVLLQYAATNSVYLYSSDGIPTKIGDPADIARLERMIRDETEARIFNDADLQDQIDTIKAASDVVDIVGTYAELEAYDTSKLNDNDIIKVLEDETHDGDITYYRWSTTTETFTYIGAQAAYYSKDETDTLLSEKQDTLIAGDNIQIAADGKTISATDTTYTAGANVQISNENVISATDTTYTAGTNVQISANNEISATDTTYSAGTGLNLNGTQFSVDTTVIAEKTDIPTVNDATLTIQKNGTDVATFTANSATNATANISVPTDTSDLTNGAGFITSADLPTKTSDLQNDGSDGTSTYVEASGLATVATTGDYDDLLDKPTIPTVNDSTITIQKNSTTVDSFTTNAASNKTINITVPTTAADVSALPDSTKYGASISVSINTTDYKVTTTLKDQDGNTLGTAQVIDLPLESVVVNGSYDSTNKKIVLTLQNGNTIDIPVGDLISGLQTEITSSNKLDADLVDDSTSINKFVTSSDITAWNGKQDALTAGSNIQINGTTISATDTTYSAMTGATSQDAGTSGLVPAPAAGDNTKYLAGDGTWKTVSIYQLPIASDTTLGGIKVGSNLSINSTTGVLSASVPTKTSDLTNDGSDGTSTYVEASDLATVATSGAYSDLTGTPSLATVATSGDYDDLLNKPTIPAAQVNSDWNASSGVAQILNKPSLATVATSGSYSDLTDKPTIPTVNNATLTVTQNGTSVGTFTANSSTDTTLALTDTTYSDMVGAGASTAGTHGLVPAPAAGDEGKYLKGDGTWGTVVSGGLVEMVYGESSAWQKFIDAYNAGKIVYCRASSNADPSSGAKTRKAFMAYVNSDTAPTSVEFQYVRSVSSKSDSQQCDQVFVYTLTNTSGGTWSVTSRNMATKVNVDSTLTKTYTTGANASMTLSAKAMTGATSGAAGTAGYVPAPAAGDDDAYLKGDGTWGTPPGTTYTAGSHIDITGSTISAEDYVHSENPVSVVDPGSTVSGSNITNGSITADKLAAGVALQLTLSTTDIGEGAALAANTLYGVYE